MSYDVKFPSKSISEKFRSNLDSISSKDIQDGIMEKVEDLSKNPRPFGRKLFKHIKPPIFLYKYTARYRIRIGDYRVLYDIDDKKKTVWILALRKRSERTYK